MGHATHFLSRLKRVEAPQVELALSLYRVTELLRSIIDASRVPDGAERLAIELADGDSPPAIVVTREGRFVTCLGQGMRHQHPVISRRTLERVSSQIAELRARLSIAEELVGPGERTDSLLRRVAEAGPWLSRKERYGFGP